MANLGEDAELVNSQNVRLEVGANRYIQLQECNIHMGRPETREPTTDNGVVYYYGKGDHTFDAVILLTTPEINDFKVLTELDVNGDMTETNFKILYQPRGGGATVTFGGASGFPAVLYDYNIEKPVEGGVLFRLRFRITSDSITVT